jgi:hypothetical protein
VGEVTYLPGRQEFDGLKTEQVKRLKDLELEDSRLRTAVSDLTLDNSFCRRLLGKTVSPASSRRSMWSTFCPTSSSAGRSAHIRSKNGPEFVTKAVQEWIAVVGANQFRLPQLLILRYRFGCRLREGLQASEQQIASSLLPMAKQIGPSFDMHGVMADLT